jgi:hypothetical protein
MDSLQIVPRLMAAIGLLCELNGSCVVVSVKSADGCALALYTRRVGLTPKSRSMARSACQIIFALWYVPHFSSQFGEQGLTLFDGERTPVFKWG